MLAGNLALNGAIVKTAGVDEENLTFRGPARVFESQESAVSGILDGTVKAGEVVVIRYEGPKGARHAGDALSHHPSQIHGLGKACVLITDGRFSGGTFRALHRPCFAGGKAAAAPSVWIKDGDIINHRHPGPQHGAGGGRQRAGARRAAVSARGWNRRSSSVRSPPCAPTLCSPPAPTRARCATANCGDRTVDAMGTGV